MDKQFVKVKGFRYLGEIENNFSIREGFITVKWSGGKLLNGRIPDYYKLVKIEDIERV
jgi:hypothetical protein